MPSASVMDPAMRWVVGGKAAHGRAASPSQMGRFETQWLATDKNLSALADLSGQWIELVHVRRPPHGIVFDMDSSESQTHGEQEMSVWNGHYACTCYHPLFVFNQFGDLEAERIKYAIRLPANQVLQDRIGYLLKRPVGRPPNEVRRFHANFSYQAGSWSKPRRVVAKVEWHPGGLYPRVGFIVTNMTRPAERVVAFYNKRGTCEQWIKEGKGAIKWTRLSCRTFAANAVRLQLHALAYNLGNFLRTLATTEPIKDVVADDLEGQADQDRREGSEPRPLCHLPDGRGRHRTANVPGDFAAHRGATAAAATSAGVRCSMSCIQEQPTEGVRPK